jgi:hypothetical protein
MSNKLPEIMLITSEKPQKTLDKLYVINRAARLIVCVAVRSRTESDGYDQPSY